MKKYLFPALALGLVMTSCQSDEPFAPTEGGEKQVTFTLNVPGELGTRAGTEDNNSGVGGWTNTQGNVSYTLVLSAEGHNQTYKKENVAGNTVTFSPTVVLGREYTVTAYTHFNATARENLTNITETKGINDESKDVYFFTTKENVSDTTINFAEGTSYNFDLKRPYAKLRLIAEDYNTTDATKPITNITEVTVSYNNEVYTVFNAVEGEFKTKANKSYSKTWDANYYEKNVTSGNKTIFADYIPVNGTDVAPFTVTVEYTNGETYTREFNQDIPVKRNALTTLKGAFFTANSEIKVEVKDAFEGQPENINFVSVSTASQLQDAINHGGNGETIILTDDIVLTEPLVFGGNSGNPAPTRSGVANSFVLNLNNNDITGTDTGTASYGLITIKKGADFTIEGNGKISLTATQNRGWNAYSSVISNQQGKLTVNGGTIEHHGGTAMAYAIDNLTNGKGTYAETIINGGTIKSTYRAIRQFLNGVEAQNILTVNGGTIESTGGNKSIWMQDANAYANSGTLNVYGDASINSAIYIEGNTSWDVEAYIEKAALKNGSTVITENVPTGYLVEENEDYYTVVTLDGILEANFAENSWENIILACQLNKIPNDWKVGDKKTMRIGDSEYNIAIIGKDHDTYTEGGKAPLTFQLTEEVYGSAAMNATQTNATGWSASQMRNVTMAEILSVMPSEVSNAIKAVDKLTLKGDGSGLETTSDKLFLMSLFEVYGSTFYSNGYEEGSKYVYYSDIEKRKMNATWWLRGPGINNGKNNGIGFTQINMSGYMANGDASTASGVVFGFCF